MKAGILYDDRDIRLGDAPEPSLGPDEVLVAPSYAGICDSDVASCRQALPDAFLNLRLSPVRMLQCSPEEVAEDAEALLRMAGPLEQVGLCCINMDYGTPDDNLFAMFEVVQHYRRSGS
ncbi:MAG TPA: hypothetical protein VLY63_23810 [Anaerolineae bacterium]|nr:hypothetical protein [Anaerolineae bacterium]